MDWNVWGVVSGCWLGDWRSKEVENWEGVVLILGWIFS